jgi:prepilin peptidase dependent protein B
VLNQRLQRAAQQVRGAAQRGMSLVELLVGVAIGLFIVSGALVVAHNQLTDTRQIQLEAQVQQDLRAAADIVVRDVRRAGTWGNALQGVWVDGAETVKLNPYTTLTLDERTRTSVQFNYHRVPTGEPEVDNDVVDNREQSGFRLNDGSLQMLLGAGNWQSLTDPLTLRVSRFDIQPRQTAVPLACHSTCVSVDCPPQLQVRTLTITLEAEARRQPEVRRSATLQVRLPNDIVTGVCP